MELNKLKHKEKESEKEKGERILEKEVNKESENKSEKENENGKIREDGKEEKLRLALKQAQKNYQQEKKEISGILARARKVLGSYLHSTYEDFPSYQDIHTRYEETLADYENFQTKKSQKEKSLLKKPKDKEEKQIKNYNHQNKPDKPGQNSQTSSKIYTKDKKEIKEPEKQKVTTKISSQDKLTERISPLAEKYQFSNEDDFISRAGKIVKTISLGSRENWEIMKNVTVSKLKESQLSVKLIRNIEDLKKDFTNLLGSQAEWREDETLKRWLARMVNSSLKKNEN